MDEFYDYDEKLRNEIILTLLDTKYKHDIDNHNDNLKFLQSMSSFELDTMLSQYYLYEIKNEK